MLDKELIKGKVVVITGASSGIGESIAKTLAFHGAIVILGARRFSQLEKVVSDIKSLGGEAYCLQTDVTVRQDLQNLVNFAIEKFKRLDVIVNNAGIMSVAPLSELKVDEWDCMIDVNIKGVLYGVAAALPVFKKQEFGHFINISSVAGLKVASPGSTVYSGTKFAIRAISDGLRHEVGGQIRTTVIEPGAVQSELKYGSSHLESRSRIIDFYEKIAIGPEAIAKAVLFTMTMPPEVDVNELVIRPTIQDF